MERRRHRLRVKVSGQSLGVININRAAMTFECIEHLLGVRLDASFENMGIKRGQNGTSFPHSFVRIEYQAACHYRMLDSIFMRSAVKKFVPMMELSFCKMRRGRAKYAALRYANDDCAWRSPQFAKVQM